MVELSYVLCSVVVSNSPSVVVVVARWTYGIGICRVGIIDCTMVRGIATEAKVVVMTKIHSSTPLTKDPNCDIIEAVVVAVRRQRDIIERLRPLKLTINIPPTGSRDPVDLEITKAKLKE